MPNPTQPKPKKAWPFFSLSCHRNGQWCKKIRGKHHYFGTDARAAHQQCIRRPNAFLAAQELFSMAVGPVRLSQSAM